MKTGFTLIELLVVVLIIGILSAIALPQYRAVVERTRMATVMSNVKHLKNMLEQYYLANGAYPADLRNVDADISGCSFSAGDPMVIGCKDSYYHYQGVGMAGVVRLTGQAYTSVYYQGLDRTPSASRAVECWALTGVEAAKRACRSLGGTPVAGETGVAGKWIIYTLN